MYPEPRLLSLGDGGLVVEFAAGVGPAANAAVIALDRALGRDPIAAQSGFGGTVPTYRSLLVLFDPLRLDRAELGAKLRRMAAAARAEAGSPLLGGREVAIPVCYEGDLALDLAEVAELCRLSPAEVVELHCGTEYRVHMIGFQIGYPYLASVPPSLRLPRLARPRLKVPAGAVAIAGELAGIYPLDSPGGWRVLGQTPVRLYDPGWEPPSLLEAGDRVRFFPVSRERYEAMRRDDWMPAGAAPRPAKAPGGAIEDPDNANAGAGGGGGATIPGLQVVDPGPLATVQDLGRPGYWRYGLGPGGAMDRFALQVGNRLLGNAAGAAAIEITGGGAELEFTAATQFVWAGPGATVTVNGRTCAPWTVLAARPGDRARLRLALDRGFRGYLCLGGGLAVPPVLGSRSTNLAAGFGGYDGRALRAGDALARYGPARPVGVAGRAAVAAVIDRVYAPLAAGEVVLDLAPGPQADLFDERAMAALYGSAFSVGPDSNRMGYRLAGPTVGASTHDIVSDGLTVGAVQVPGNGQPVLLMADHQTTGGYPKPGVVAADSVVHAAQLVPGRRVRFAAITVETARRRRLGLEHAVAAACGRAARFSMNLAGRHYEVTVDLGPAGGGDASGKKPPRD